MTNQIKYRTDPKIDEKKVCTLLSENATWKVPTDPNRWRQILDNSAAVISAWDGDNLVGFTRGLSDTVRFAQVLEVLVHPEYREQGIGRELVSRLLDQPVMAVRGVILGTPDKKAFYEKLGFKCLNEKAYLMVMVRDQFSQGMILPINPSP